MLLIIFNSMVYTVYVIRCSVVDDDDAHFSSQQHRSKRCNTRNIYVFYMLLSVSLRVCVYVRVRGSVYGLVFKQIIKIQTKNNHKLHTHIDTREWNRWKFSVFLLYCMQ